MGWPSDQPGGLNRYLCDLHRSLREQGVDAQALVVGPAGSPPEGVIVTADARDPLPSRVLACLRATRRMATHIGVVDSHFALYAAAPLLVGPLRGKPLVVHFQGPWADESAAAGRTSWWMLAAKRKLERAVYKRADELIVLSAAFKRILVERYGVSPWNVEVLPPGVDLGQFRRGPRRDARKALGLSEDTWVTFTARRLVPRTGVDVLLDAWTSVTQSYPDEVLLLVAGDGPSRAALEQRAAAAGLGDRVRFLGRISDDELVACYQAADVCVVPSTTLEGFGLVVLEALACGTPVVATDSGGLPEALTGLDPSLVVPRGDPGALARRLVRAANGTSPLPTTEACRAHAERFSWAAVTERTVEIYRKARFPGKRDRPRVVYLDHCARLSGGELALVRLLSALTDVDAHVILAEDGPLVPILLRQGISVEVLPIGETARGLPKDRVQVRRLPLGALFHSAGYVCRLAWRLRRLRPDLVHTNSLKAMLWGGLASRLAGVPVIFHIRDRIADDYLPSPAVRLMRAAVRWLPAAVIANSEATLSTLGRLSKAAVIASPFTVVYDSVQRAEPRSGEGRPLRVGIVGRLAPWKGQHVFLEAFARAFAHGTEEAAVVGAPLFGEDDYESELHRLAERLGLDGRVEFRGFREDVVAELANLDVLVHASVIPEPFGQVVLEGMAMALPVVAAGDGGPGELIDHLVDGVLYPMGDVEALAGELQRLAADEGLRARLGAAAFRRAEEFRPENAAEQVLSLYRHVLAGTDLARTSDRHKKDREDAEQ